MYTHSDTETEQLGRSLAAQLRPGDVLLLYGELGAGKTVFSRGVARGLGIEGPIASPTFTLLALHEGGRIPLHHFDLYRLEDADAFEDAGLAEYVHPAAVSLIEWPERAMAALPAAHLAIHIAYGDAEGERKIAILPRGGFREVSI